MKDITLYDELLGLKQPWYVAGVRLDVVKQEVEVEVRSKGHNVGMSRMPGTNAYS